MSTIATVKPAQKVGGVRQKKSKKSSPQLSSKKVKVTSSQVPIDPMLNTQPRILDSNSTHSDSTKSPTKHRPKQSYPAQKVSAPKIHSNKKQNNSKINQPKPGF